jgi:hypothetical protein
MENKFSNYMFRCSALGNIISKSGKLTDGVKTYLQECFIGEIYKVRKEAYGKALEKGVLCEEDGISMLQNIYPGQLLLKNKEEKRNGLIKGSCDVFKNSIVHDIKNAYTLFTFGKAEKSWIYEWQVKGYAMLWNTKKGRLFYCLNNMPEQMLLEEERLLFYKNKWAFVSMEDENYLKACEELRAAHKYDHMPIYERFKVWDIDYTDNDTEIITASVEAGRKYLGELWEEHCEMVLKNMSLIGLIQNQPA